MRAKIASIVLAVVATLVVAIDLAWAGSPTERLRIFFSETNAIIRGVDRERGTEASRTALLALVNDVFDFPGAAARALGPEWIGRTPSEREEFVRLFADLLERGYVAMLGSKVRVRGGLTIAFVGESVRGDSATVATTMLTRAGNELPVNYRLGRHGSRWAVQDVEIDGVSLVGNYRAQFRRVLRASSYGDLVAQMRGKVLDSPRAVTAAEALPAAPVAAGTVAADAPGFQPPLPAAAPTATTVPPPPAAAPAGEPPAVAPPRVEPRAATPPGGPGEPRTPPAATKPSSATKATTTRVRYWVQVGAFQSADAASRLAERLRSRVANVSTPSTALTDSDPAPLARVLVGPFAKRAHALAKLKELEKRGYRGFIVTEMRD